MKKTTIFVVLFVVLAILSACATPAATEVVEEEAAAGGDAVLTVGEKSYTQTELEALGTVDADYTDKEGVTTTYTGVSLATLIEDAGLSGGENVTFIASDGYEAELTVAEVMDCANCIVGFDEGSLRTVMPDFSGKLNVKDVVEIKVD